MSGVRTRARATRPHATFTSTDKKEATDARPRTLMTTSCLSLYDKQVLMFNNYLSNNDKQMMVSGRINSDSHQPALERRSGSDADGHPVFARNADAEVCR